MNAPMTTLLTPSLIAQGNNALRDKEYDRAIRFYIQALQATPVLAKIINGNIELARQRYQKARQSQSRQRVGVCGWELAHNAAGRVYTLAKLYETFADVEIIGSIFPTHGREVWEPIRNTTIPCHTFVVDDQSRFIEQAIELVAANPYDIVHLSKPRAPNIFFGILYKQIWDAKVLVDIDDEELAFVGAETPISIDEYIKQYDKLPEIKDLGGKDWTRIAVGLAREFDGITVSNPALQQRYGGEIIRHARDNKQTLPSADLKNKSRKKYGIPDEKKVVLFFGTPREHKGLEQIADAIASLKGNELIFVIVGDFLDTALKSRLQAKKDVEYIFIGDQPFDAVSEITAMGDYCILHQNIDTYISRFQIPAKLTDAMASGLTVIASNCPPFADIIAVGAVVPSNRNLSKTIQKVINGEINLSNIQNAATRFYLEEMTISVNGKRLEKILKSQQQQRFHLSQKLMETIIRMPGYQTWPVAGITHWPPSINAAKDKPASVVRQISMASPPASSWEKRPTPPSLPLTHQNKLPITVLIITWDVGHNPLGRSYMLAEVVQRVARHALLVGFQFPRYGDAVWEPVRQGKLPVISLPGSNLPEFHESLQNIAKRIRPDVVIACKPRLPSVELGMMLREQWGCPLIIDVDDHELSFFRDQTELNLDELAAMPAGSADKEVEPYAEIWTRLTQSLCKSANEILVSNIALQREFGGTIVPHVRDETTFDPVLYKRLDIRRRYGVPDSAKVVLFFGTPRVHKGVDTLARAVSQIADPHFRLLIVGTAPDRSVTAKLDTVAPGRVIYLPNQPFGAIPEILSMADVVCLPQDEGHSISQFQLPAKAIDAVAMGVPLLVSNTPPLMQLVQDGVAEFVGTEDIPAALQRLGGDPQRAKQWGDDVRSRFLNRYSYAAAALQMREIILRSLSYKYRPSAINTTKLITASHHVLGLPLSTIKIARRGGIDIVVFWKQNDTGLYGRRHDMVIKYLSSRPDVRKVIVFDAPISEFDLIKRQQATSDASQDRWIYVGTYEKLLGVRDTEKISYNTFTYPPGKFRNSEADTAKPNMLDGYLPYINEVLIREGVDAKKSVFWIYPKNYSAPELIRHFRPIKVVVDVVDDHRAWPNTSDKEKERLTENYRDILALADMAFTNCEPVQQSMKEFFPDILMVPNGCDSTPPAVIPKNSSEYEAFCNWPGKTIGYIGNLESKIDIELLDKLAERFHDCQIVLIGSTHANPAILQLQRHHNIRMPGVVPYKEAGAWVSRFDVGLVPHLNSELTQNMNPLKIFVYLAFNVPVVSTEISNIDRSSTLVCVEDSNDNFLSAVDKCISRGRPSSAEFEKYVKSNNWSARLKNDVNKLLGNIN